MHINYVTLVKNKKKKNMVVYDMLLGDINKFYLSI